MSTAISSPPPSPAAQPRDPGPDGPETDATGLDGARPDDSAPGAATSPARLVEHAARARERVVDLCASAEGGHLGGSMSALDILVALYFAVLRIDPADPRHPDRDILLLSKGHAALGLYAVLAERGFFPPGDLASYGGPDSVFLAHPHPRTPGVEMPSGSLGHGLPLGVGFSLAARLDGSARRCFVVLGDGELQEGSVWEAAAAAGSLGLGRLTAVVDRNGLQITGRTEEVIALEPLADRWRAFGWAVREVDGHDFGALVAALGAPPSPDGRPTAVIARTVKGRGLPYIEGQVRSHFAKLGGKQYQKARAVLAANSGGGSGARSAVRRAAGQP